MFLVDGAGALIDDWTFSVGTGEGASIELASVPKLLADTDGAGTTADAVMESELTGIAFERVNDPATKATPWLVKVPWPSAPGWPP